jgi:tetratricopeptide (TPR) repeat protein
MKRVVSFFSCILFCLYSYSQQDIISIATGFITRYHYDSAEHYLDSVLKRNPKNVDALMMKGNVLLNYSWQNTSESYFTIERAESIFDTAAIDQSFFIPVIPYDTSRLIENYWRKCLQIDSTRTDILKGLCSLYSISLRTRDLKKLLHEMQGYITKNEENAFRFAEYARNIKARGKFDEGIQVYQLIADMFPALPGIRCDIAAEYFYAGKLNDCLRYLDSALTKKDIDQTTFINAAAFYSLLGYYDKALETFQKYSETDTLVEGDFYKGLVMFANMDSGFYIQLEQFLKMGSEQNYSDEVHLAQKLLPFGRSGFTLDDYESLVDNEKIPRYYRVLILQRGVRQFRYRCEPLEKFGSFECSIKNYAAAVQFLEDESCDKNNGPTEQQILNSSFALYKTGAHVAAVKEFSRLLTSKNVFLQQAAQYFTGKIYVEDGRKPEAKKIFSDLAASPAGTKYSWLTKNLGLN